LYLREKPKQNKENDLLEEQTIATYVRSLRVILYFFMEKGYLKPFSFKLPMATKKVKKTYTVDEIEKLLEKPNMKTCRFSEYRNWVIENYLLATGNRISTVRDIKIEDLDFETETIMLRTVKNKTQYKMPMSKQLKKVLIEYLIHRKGESNEFLFCSERDGKRPLSRSGLQKAIADYNNRRGVSKTSAHIFRHFFANHYLRKGGQQLSLQSLLGHKTLTMVREYVDMLR